MQDSLWSNPNNWQPAGIPQNGDDLLLNDSSVVSGPDPAMNDLTNLAVNSISFSIGALSSKDWNLNGNTIIISNTAPSVFGPYAIQNTDNGNSYVHINCGLKLATDATFVTGATDGEGDVTPMYLTGPIDLNGHVLKFVGRPPAFSQI